MKIRKRKLPSGTVAFQLDLGLVDGKRVRKNYKTKAEAALEMERAKEQQLRFGTSLVDLTPAEIAEILLVRGKLAAAGATLSQAAEFFLARGVVRKQAITLEQLVQRFTDSREEASARYARQLRVSLGSLAKALDGKLCSDVMTEDIETWLRSNDWKPKTRNNYLGDVSAMFGWAVREGYVGNNPAAGIKKARDHEGEIGTLNLEQCRQLLEAAVHAPGVAGFVVLGLFAGLRPAEIARLDWSAVDADAGTVVVAGRHAKTRQRRVVDLSPNARAWLQAAAVPKAGPITGKWWDGRWRLFRQKLGWDVGDSGDGLSRYARIKPREKPSTPHGRWPHNALRHTFASMHYAQHQNEALLQAQMGHESAAMLHRHYRAVKTRAEAAQFWSLRPSAKLRLDKPSAAPMMHG